MSYTVVASIALLALLLAATPGVAQTPVPIKPDAQAKAAKAKRLAQAFERNARVITVFDREGKVVTTVGQRAIYNQGSAISPDGKRVAVVKFDQEKDVGDIWVLDVATGASTRITSTEPEDGIRLPVWSPDGSQLAYVALRGSYERVYRKASNGEGAEELLYQYPGAGMTLADWSKDGRFLSLFTSNLSGAVVYVLPLGDDKERTLIEVFRSDSRVGQPRFSPDGRFLSYVSDPTGRSEIYVRPFDPLPGTGASVVEKSSQLSDKGVVQGHLFWRDDGREAYYLAADLTLMAVEVTTAPTLAFGKPKLLFRPPAQGSTGLARLSVSQDGRRIAIAVHPAPIHQQITVLDRQGNVLNKVGEPGNYVNPSLSPDGKRVAVVGNVPGGRDIWTFDVASGKRTPVTADTAFDNDPIWSPDGTQVAYVSERGSFSSIYRKAWDGTGVEEKLFQYTPGAYMTLSDWASDGKFLTFHDGCSGVLHVMSLGGNQNALERKAIDWLRDEYSVAQARFSPDSRFMAYLSDEVEAEKYQVYVRPFDASQPEAGASYAKPVQVSTSGARGMIFWRGDGKEMYFLSPDWEVMVVDVTTTPAFRAGTPRLLFKLPGPLAGDPQQWRNVSRDGERFVFAINVPVNVTAR